MDLLVFRRPEKVARTVGNNEGIFDKTKNLKKCFQNYVKKTVGLRKATSKNVVGIKQICQNEGEKRTVEERTKNDVPMPVGKRKSQLWNSETVWPGRSGLKKNNGGKERKIDNIPGDGSEKRAKKSMGH